MIKNRSMPNCTIIPVVGYNDVDKAISWLCDNIGFTVRWRIENHRAQLALGDSAIAVAQNSHGHCDMMIRVADAHALHDKLKNSGVEIEREPIDFNYGERQFIIKDFEGHVWTFSESIADANPEDWGAEVGTI